MVKRKSLEEFRDSGLLWLINTLLHTFGWAICIDFEDGKATEMYPARVKFRGFNEKNNDEGYLKVAKYMKENASEILSETEDGM